MENSVIAITVTFNSSKLVARAIEYINNQTYKVDKIIVVDNNSKEIEKEKLRLLELKYNNIDFIWLEENLGGAAGFYEGMKYAREIYNPDWYWIMDDDAFPNIDCLEKLITYSQKNEAIQCIVPLIYGIDNKEFQLYHHKKLSKFLHKDVQVFDSYSDIKDINIIEANAFVGPLFSRNVIDSVGFVDKDLFIYGDDLEYTYRVSRRFNIYLIKGAIINHQDKPINGIQKPSAWWKDYYMYRNRLIFISEYQKNYLFKGIGKLLVILRIFKQIIIILFTCNEFRLILIRYKLLIQAFKDGMLKRKGKIIDPIKYVSENFNN